MCKSIFFSLCTLAVLVCATQTTAQFVQLPNPGCGNSTAMRWSGTGQIGTQIGVKMGCSSIGETGFLFMGGAGQIPIAMPLACATGCVLELTPWLVIQGNPAASTTIMIPSLRTLVGAKLRFQGLCLNTIQLCLTVSVAVELTIN